MQPRDYSETFKGESDDFISETIEDTVDALTTAREYQSTAGDNTSTEVGKLTSDTKSLSIIDEKATQGSISDIKMSETVPQEPINHE